MAIGAIPQHDYIVLVPGPNGGTVYGVFENWSEAMGFRNRLPGKQKDRGIVKPINGVG